MRNGLSIACFIACAALTFAAGCGRSASETSNVEVELAFDPAPPQTGDVDVRLTLAERSGSPLAGADVRLEGNMNHAGMKPSFADLVEIEPGRYAGKLDFTMGGDWFVLVTAKTRDGNRVEHKVDVPGVKAR
jgi:hypothetical protein